LEITRTIGYQLGEATQLGNMALVLRKQGLIAEARTYYQQALDISRRLGDQQNEAIWLGGIGDLLAEQDQHEQALAY